MSQHERRMDGPGDPEANELSERFADACGMSGVLRLIVRDYDSGSQTKHDLNRPSVVIGSQPGCHIRLSHPDVSGKHVLVQVLQGRVYCFDLGSRTGTRFLDGLREHGVLSGADSLVIGPFQVRLSQAPAYGMYATDDGDPDFTNRPTGEIQLVFRNPEDRSAAKTTGRLREKVTLIGRSGDCHIRLTHDGVEPVQCAVVRTPIGDWVVDLASGASSGAGWCRLLSPDREFDVGPLRMQSVSESQLSLLESTKQTVESGDPLRAVNVHTAVHARALQTQHSTSLHNVPPGASSEEVVLAAIERLGEMQQQALHQSHQRSMMLAQIIASMRQKQHGGVSEQLKRLQTAAADLVESHRSGNLEANR